jgi:cytoskeletal protein RodZ
MVQFNLLPDIKIQYLRARRQKHLVLLTSIVTVIVCVTAMIILISIVFVLQKKNISDLSRDINAAGQELSSTPDLTKMLTVQNQLAVLPRLHEEKAVAGRLFDYVTQSTPTQASISRLNADFAQSTMTVSGSADSLVTINTFVDTLKFTTYHTKNVPNEEKPAFTSVVLSSFGRDSSGASYTITFAFDRVIFSEVEEVTLIVPKKITTRSQIEQPAALFQDTEGEQ